MSREQPPEDTRFMVGDKLWWKVPGQRLRATFIEMSKSGKRAYIEYEYHVYDRKFTQRSYVDPTRLESRSE